MNASTAIRKALESTHRVLTMYLGDLSDADLLVRPVPGANTIAWQVGHLIRSESMAAKHIPAAKYPELPAGFADRHDNKRAGDDGPGLATKAVYLDLFAKAREATLKAVDGLSETDLDKPTGWEMAPTLGQLLLLIANHTMMHAGQFTVVRRKLGKPVLF
jgi:uncharacterized damage-inducible protein DinB